MVYDYDGGPYNSWATNLFSERGMMMPNDQAHIKILHTRYVNTKGDPILRLGTLWNMGVRARAIIWHHEGAYSMLSRSFVETIFRSFDNKVATGAQKNSLEYDVSWSQAREIDYDIGKMLIAGPTN